MLSGFYPLKAKIKSKAYVAKVQATRVNAASVIML
jgi:hypothetical protein